MPAFALTRPRSVLMDKLLTSRHGPWVTGGILELLAVLLVKLVHVKP